MLSVYSTVSIHRLLRAWPDEISTELFFDGVSIHRLLRAWPSATVHLFAFAYRFDPQALTSLTNSYPPKNQIKQVSIHRLLRAWPYAVAGLRYTVRFRSTGSYEPDHYWSVVDLTMAGFDPQALTSLTLCTTVFLNGSGSFDPQALTSLTSKNSWF